MTTVPLELHLDAHRRLRGPYSAAGALARALAPALADRWPDLVARHDVELRTVAPELAGLVAGGRETLTSAATPEERTRFYPRARTRRVAHGLVDLVNEVVAGGGGLRRIVVEHVAQADPTDAEWLELLRRRIDPRVVVVDAPEALRPSAGELTSAEAAARFVDGDGTSDDPVLVAAYGALGADERAVLHDTRAAALEAAGEPSLRLGAIPYHRTRGADPKGAGAAALIAAVEHCVLMGFYDAVIDLGRQGLDLLGWDERPEDCWLLVAKIATALTALDRPDEAADLYDEACAASTLPSVHLQAAYGRAMLFTRFYDAERLDHQRAKAHINTAIAISELLPEGERRAFNLTFNENGLALIEMHLGDVEHALALVTAGLERLDREIGPDEQTLHRSVLRYNRAQLLTRTGPPAAALAEYTLAIASDLNHSEYYFERAAVHRRLGDLEAALADYEAAIRLSPPYPEPHCNLADVAIELGRFDVALAHLGRVLDLEPDFVEAYASRAGARWELGDADGAATDVATGLALTPDHAELRCLAGTIALAAGDLAAAGSAFDAAVAAAPGLLSAWANRAVLAFELGDVAGAVEDLSTALAIEDRADLRLDRALALESLDRLDEAVADFDAALADPDLAGDARAGRDRCLASAA